MDVVFLVLEIFRPLYLEDSVSYEWLCNIFDSMITNVIFCVDRIPCQLPFTVVMEALRIYSNFHCKLMKFFDSSKRTLVKIINNLLVKKR